MGLGVRVWRSDRLNTPPWIFILNEAVCKIPECPSPSSPSPARGEGGREFISLVLSRVGVRGAEKCECYGERGPLTLWTFPTWERRYTVELLRIHESRSTPMSTPDPLHAPDKHIPGPPGKEPGHFPGGHPAGYCGRRSTHSLRFCP